MRSKSELRPALRADDQKRETSEYMIDLYEELLFRKASQGVRPVLYLSSQTDLECTLLGLCPDESKQVGDDKREPSAPHYFSTVL